MRDVLLVIRADFGTFFCVQMPLSKANEIVDKHLRGGLPARVGGYFPNGGSWSVESSKIILCHTQELETVNQGQSQQQPTWKLSGI